MNVIYQIYKKFLNGFRVNNNTKDTHQLSDNENLPTETYVGGFQFKLTDDLEIDLACIMPDMEILSSEDILDISEKYAELLIMINHGLFKDQILDMIKKRTKSNLTSDKEKLFADNVLSFHKILIEELNKQANTSHPLIRPTSVFKSTQLFSE